MTTVQSAHLYDPIEKRPRPDALNLDDFALLGLEPAYAIPRQTIEFAFMKLAALVHPDRYASAPDDVRNLADALSTKLSRAKTRLTDDFTRADYLVTLKGGPTAGNMKTTPVDFLMEIMALSEQVQSGGDARRDALERIAGLSADLYAQLARDMAELTSARALEQARLTLNKISYLRKMEQDTLQQA